MPTHSILLISGDEAPVVHIGAWLNDRSDYVLAGHCRSLGSATSYCHTLEPAVLLVDLETPDTADAAHWLALTRSFPHAPIISLITAGTDEAAHQRATNGGALLSLPKDSDQAEFSSNLESALRWAVEVAIERALQPFTAREREVLCLLAAGLSNAELAQQLGVSEKTIKRHVGGIMEKLGVDSRMKAARWAWEQGLG